METHSQPAQKRISKTGKVMLAALLIQTVITGVLWGLSADFRQTSDETMRAKQVISAQVLNDKMHAKDCTWAGAQPE